MAPRTRKGATDQLTGAWRELQANFTPSTCPIFQEKCANMIAEHGDVAAHMTEADEMDIARTMWRLWRAASVERKLGPKVNMCRFMAAPRAMQQLLKGWSDKAARVEYCALESGMLGRRQIHALKLKESAADTLDAIQLRPSTDPARLTSMGRALRISCANACVIAVQMLVEPYNKQLCQLLVTVVRPAEQWHGTQNHVLRSTAASKEWLRDQSAGGYMQHVQDILWQLQRREALQAIGLTTASRDCELLSNDDLVSEDTAADMFGTMCWVFATKRVVRTLWFTRGWPLRFLAALQPEWRQRALDDFRADFRAFQYTRDLMADPAHQTAKGVKLVERSVFHDTSVQQFVEAWVGC